MNDVIEISTDKNRLDVSLIHQFLSHQAYWSRNIPPDVVQRSIDHSLCFGVYLDGQQIGFGRVITDYATFGYLADVFMVPEQRGKGFSKQLVAYVLQHEALQGIRRLMLVTRDAHGLYSQFGFTPIDTPENTMSIKFFADY